MAEENVLILQEEVARLQSEVTALKSALYHKDALLDQLQQQVMMFVPDKKITQQRKMKPETIAKREFHKIYKDNPDLLENLRRAFGLEDSSMIPPKSIKLFTDLLYESTNQSSCLR